MTLKFDQVLDQVQRMGRSVAYRTQEASERGQRALDEWGNLGSLEAVHDRIRLVREKDAGYRGAAAHRELLNQAFVCPPAPDRAVVVAVDGSQVYPDLHAPALYYLTNVGRFTYFHGQGELPLEGSSPELFYADSDLREHHGHGSVIKNTAVNLRRDVKELQALTLACWDQRELGLPLVGLRDGRLLWWAGKDAPDADRLQQDYRRSLGDFYEVHLRHQHQFGQNASLAGYVESDDSSFVIRLLHLMSLEEDQITRTTLETAGDYEGLNDGWLFSRVLRPGQRSAVMIQQSPQNRDYKRHWGQEFEITFFYLNVGSLYKPHIARIEIPFWVAQSDQAIEEVHSLVWAQTQLANPYPYVLTRADELARVSNMEKQHLENMIVVELLKHDQDVDKSPKLTGKEQTRSPKISYQRG